MEEDEEMKMNVPARQKVDIEDPWQQAKHAKVCRPICWHRNLLIQLIFEENLTTSTVPYLGGILHYTGTFKKLILATGVKFTYKTNSHLE